MEQNIWTSNIQTWLDNRKNASLGLLAKRADIPYPTLRRVFQGERRPSYATAVKIAFETMQVEDAICILEKEYGQPSVILRALSKGQTPMALADDSRSIDRLDDFIIVSLCLAKNGCTRAAIFNRFGNSGLDRLNKLLDRGLLAEGGGRLFLKDDQRTPSLSKDTAKLAKLSLDLLNEDSIGLPGVLGYFGVGGLSREGITRIENILNEARQAIAAVFTDGSLSGDSVLAVTVSSVPVSNTEE